MLVKQAARLVLGVGLPACSATADDNATPRDARTRPTPVLCDGPAIPLEPLRIARVEWKGGTPVLAGEWEDYAAGSVRASDAIFDCYGDADNDSLQLPDDATCGMGSQRWYFGPTYCNSFVSNDMRCVDSADGAISGAQYAWYWYGDGDVSNSSPCIIIIGTQESNPDSCEANTFDYPGVAISYGPIPNNPGNYYVNQGWADLTGVEPVVPSDGAGSYILMLANAITSTAIVLAECGQFMLWGCSDNGSDPGRPGAQDAGQLDDVNPSDGYHDVPNNECYSYDFHSLCPAPMGAMAMFRGVKSAPCEYADFNDSGGITTKDVSAFLNAWVAQRGQDCSGGCSADCDLSGRVNTQDVACFLNAWVSCRD